MKICRAVPVPEPLPEGAPNYTRLNKIGATLPKSVRNRYAAVAMDLRARHAGLPPDLRAEDDLLELADQLDTLAMPIVVSK